MRMRGEVFNGTLVVNAGTFGIESDGAASGANNAAYFKWNASPYNGGTSSAEWMRLYRSSLYLVDGGDFLSSNSHTYTAWQGNNGLIGKMIGIQREGSSASVAAASFSNTAGNTASHSSYRARGTFASPYVS